MTSFMRKLLGTDSEHRSRWHTRRGETTSADMIRSAMQRKKVSTEPWMVSAAVSRLTGILTADMTLLELGSGASTTWYSDRVGLVVSVEPDPAWAIEVRQRLGTRNNVEIRLASVQQALVNIQSFDVVIVDHLDEPAHSRIDSIRRVRETASLIVLDDSDRTVYSKAKSLLPDWIEERYVGFRSKPFRASETTIFYRPGEATDEFAR